MRSLPCRRGRLAVHFLLVHPGDEGRSQRGEHEHERGSGGEHSHTAAPGPKGPPGVPVLGSDTEHVLLRFDADFKPGVSCVAHLRGQGKGREPGSWAAAPPHHHNGPLPVWEPRCHRGGRLAPPGPGSSGCSRSTASPRSRGSSS